MYNISPLPQELFKWGIHIYEDDQEEMEEKEEQEEEEEMDEEGEGIGEG